MIRRRRKKKLVLTVTVSAVMLLGCRESEDGAFFQSGVVEQVNLAEIETPEKVNICSTSFWDASEDQIFDCFLHGNIVKTEAWAEGPRYVTDGEQESICLRDGGIDWFGRVQDGFSQNGISYSFYYDTYGYENSDVPALLRDFPIASYYNNGEDPRYRIAKDRAANGKEREYIKTKELVLAYMKKLSFPDYQVQEAAVISDLKGEKDICLMYFCQTYDGIPFTNLRFEKSGSGSGYIYNRELNFDEDMLQLGSQVEIFATEQEGIVRWDSDATVMVEEVLGTYQTVDVDKAYQKVKNLYHSIPVGRNPRLTYARLQYESLQKGDEMRLIPVWIFGVTETEKDSDGAEKEVCTYYIVNAVTGEFFTDMDLP